MVRPIMKDMLFLGCPSTEATMEDLPVAFDLLETLRAHAHECVGMAANMIGIRKKIIVFFDGSTPTLMLNPVILTSEGMYEAEEGCLSLSGIRKAVRYRKISVQYQNERLQLRRKTYSGFTAQIIQHEIDHLNGILI